MIELLVLTFNVSPKFVYVTGQETYDGVTRFMWSYDQTAAMAEYMSNGTTSQQMKNQVILNSNILSWYAGTRSEYGFQQMNSSGITYIWLCIG